MSKRKTIKQFIEEAEEAFNVYKKAKEKHIASIAETLFKEGKITKKVYDAMMSYKVEITD